MVNSFKTNNSTLTRSICAIVFILFTFIYLYCFQADVLSMEQHVLSGGTTHYDRTVGAILITLILCLLQLGVNKLTGFVGVLYAMTYFPSLLLLAVLTAANHNFGTSTFSGRWLLIASLLLIIFICFSIFYKRKSFPSDISFSKENMLGNLWKNLLLLAIMFIATCSVGNNNDIFHYRLRIERLLNTKDYTKALAVGAKSDGTDGSLTMLRAYALSRNKQLGERLFEYPVARGGSRTLLPNGKDIKCMFFSENEIYKYLGIRKKGNMKPMEYLLYLENNGLAMKSVTDYILCGYLLDKDLDGFVNEIRKKYNLTSPSLPKHYKEALTLYTHLRAYPVLVFHNEIMDVDYADFQKLEREYKGKSEKMSYVKDTYGETYWFYYFYHQ